MTPATTAPVTAGQQRLWFLAQLDPDSVEYHIPLAYRLCGPLDRTALAAALGDIVARHGALRTRFPLVGEVPAQEILAGWRLEVEQRDLSGPDPLGRARRLVAALANAPFDLTAAPPLRAAVLRLGADDHVLCLVVHHILADDWSLDLLCDELAKGYLARLAGEPAVLSALPIQYADHARALAEQAEAGEQAALSYWRDRLAGAEPLELPTDLPRPAVRGTAGAFDGFQLGPAAAAAVRRLGRAGRTTPFMTLLAGYLALLALYSGQRDICVGTPVSGRDRTELEPLIGFFLNTVVLRGDLSGDPSFRELLGRVKATAIEAFGHRDLPVERLMLELDAHRDPARTPLFDTMLIVHSRGMSERLPRLPGIAAEYLLPGHHQVKFDLTVECVVAGDGLKVVASYRSDLFQAASIASLVRRLGTLLELAADSPDEPLSRLYTRLAEGEAGPDADRTASVPLGPARADGALPHPPPRPAPCQQASEEAAPWVLELFTAQVTATPDAVAVSHGDTRLTYAELHRRAAVLAGLLRERGAGPGGLVGLLLPPGADLVTAVLAVWMSGAAYLPLDPDAPPRRLAYQLADSAPAVVVTGQRPPAHDPIMDIDIDIGDVDWSGPAVAGSPGPLAYAVYTSGSTGQPKAVAVSHAALAARVAWMRADYGIGPADRVLQFSSPSFDAFAEEVYPCLTAGATLVVPTGSRAALPDFLATGQGRALTVFDLPTSYWHELVTGPHAVAWPPALRLLILGGEQVRGDALARWFEVHGDRVEVRNTYGPTEATIIATAARLTPADAAGRPPIGFPIGDTCVHLLSEGGGPVPDGVPGELLIGGAGVADGYLGRAELTAARFAAFRGSRHYRTGDWARRRPDGVLEFLGRRDDQLKVRGYRVEAGEVVAALTAHPAIRHAVVTVDGEGRLVSHLVPQPGAAIPGPADLRSHLAELLPAYARPQAYGVIDRLPLTRHGKVDRTALPPVSAAGSGPASEPPRSDAEVLVAAVWADVLGVGEVGAHDDFFALGGHSLLATRVAARLRAGTGLDIPLRTIFQRTTVAELAGAVEELLIAEIEALDDDEVHRQLAGPAR